MKKKPYNITDDLLVRYLIGDVSAEETGMVQQWLQEDNANKKYLDGLSLIWYESKKLAPHDTINEDDAWQRFNNRINTVTTKGKTLPIRYRNIAVAATLLLLVGVYAIYHFQTVKYNKQLALAQLQKTIKENLVNKNANGSVCNVTPCPIEICIVQSLKCKSVTASEVSTCSTIEPDQSGELVYKAFDRKNANCNFSIKEIRIKRVSTGETIILTEHSNPVTAQDLFDYMTGQKKGDIVAGIFHTDCNNRSYENRLRVDNKFGDLILQ